MEYTFPIIQELAVRFGSVIGGIMTWLTFIEHLCQRLILRIDMFAIVPIPSSFPFLLLSTDLAKRRVARRMSLVGLECLRFQRTRVPPGS
jgi:hypothetical protein